MALSIRSMDGDGAIAAIPALADLLIDCVAGGASVGFLAPLDRGKTERFWQETAADIAAGHCILIVAEAAGAIVGTVQLRPARPENQPHRADIAKLLVQPAARRRGIGAALMAEAEAEALRRGRTLLLLDTATPEAARLYARAGWIRAGTIPGYALLPDGKPCATIFFYKCLA